MKRKKIAALGISSVLAISTVLTGCSEKKKRV